MTQQLAVNKLFSEVERYRPSYSDAWSRIAKGFADALRRVAPALRQLAMDCYSLGKIGSYVYYWEVQPCWYISSNCSGSLFDTIVTPAFLIARSGNSRLAIVVGLS